MKEVQFSILSGYTLENIHARREVIFTTTCGKAFVLLNTHHCYMHEGSYASVLNSTITSSEYFTIKKKYKFQDSDTNSFSISTEKGSCTFSWLGGSQKLYEVTEDDNDELAVKAKVLSNSPTVIVEYTDNEEVYFRVVTGKTGLEFCTEQAYLYGSVEELAATLLGSAKPLDVSYKYTEELKMKEFTFSSLKLVKFSELLGKTLTAIDVDDIRITFTTTEGTYVQYHEQDCCESVWLEGHDGDITDLLNYPLTMADEATSSKYEDGESVTWSFYKLSTTKGCCTFTWRGESNGYYSETVSLFKVEN